MLVWDARVEAKLPEEVASLLLSTRAILKPSQLSAVFSRDKAHYSTKLLLTMLSVNKTIYYYFRNTKPIEKATNCTIGDVRWPVWNACVTVLTPGAWWRPDQLFGGPSRT